MSDPIRDARALLGFLVEERRAAIAADALNPSGRIRGGIVAIQAEIAAVGAALAEETKAAAEKRDRKLAHKAAAEQAGAAGTAGEDSAPAGGSSASRVASARNFGFGGQRRGSN